MSREKCPECGAFVRGCEKCEKRPSLAIPPSPTKTDEVFRVTVAEIIAWTQRREARGLLPTIEDFVADLREGRI